MWNIWIFFIENTCTQQSGKQRLLTLDYNYEKQYIQNHNQPH